MADMTERPYLRLIDQLVNFLAGISSASWPLVGPDPTERRGPLPRRPPTTTPISPISPTPGGNPSDRPPPRSVPRPSTPSIGTLPFIFGAAVPSPAPTAPSRGPRRRRGPRPKRRGRPARPPRPTRPPDPRIPEAPEPTPAPRRAPPSRRPSPIPVDIPTSVPDALFGLWRRLLDEYLRGPKRRPSPAGGPRRGGSRTGQVDLPPGRGNIPFPGPLTVELPTPQGRPEPSEIFSPRAPISSPFPDPYTYVPTPAPAPVRRPGPREVPNLHLGNPVPWSMPQVRTRGRRQPRGNDGSNRPRETTDIGRLRSGAPNPLTQLQRGKVELPAQSSNPCQQAAREAKRRQRRRRKECTKWITKEIRVCQSSNVR